MIARMLHLSQLGSDPWVLPIYSRANQTQQIRGREPLPDEVKRLGLQITMRLNLLPSLIERLNSDMGLLLDQAKGAMQPEHVFTPTHHDAIALQVDDHLKYLVICDLHAFVAELDACMDHMKQFMMAIHNYVEQPIDDNQRIEIINGWMAVDGIDPRWVKRLAGARNYVAHTGPLYLGIDVSNSPWDLLLLKEVVVIPKPNQCFRLTELDGIARGFTACKSAFQRHLMSLLS